MSATQARFPRVRQCRLDPRYTLVMANRDATPAPEPSPAQPQVVDALLPLVYAELRVLAARFLQAQAQSTLQPTALVHEAYLKLKASDARKFNDRTHTLAVAALAMRQILADRARSHRAHKHGGASERITLSDVTVADQAARQVDLVALDDALDKLERCEPRHARVVELRFFAGLDNAEIAAVLGIAKRTVEQDWRLARAWLGVELAEEGC